jgi:hypothetical protein
MLEIKPVSYSEILDDARGQELIRAYAASCIVPDAEPQRQLYEAMEKAGIIHAFGAYVRSDGLTAPLLVGFASVICSTMPHDGHLVATLGEMFIDLPYRSTDAEDLLLSAVEKVAVYTGCRCIICLARTDSKYSKRLSQREGFNQTHSQYTKWLNGYGGKA